MAIDRNVTYLSLRQFRAIESPILNAPMTYRPDIDGLRAVSVLAVMAYHLDHSFLRGGFVGVDVFFVISGFVVTSALVNGRAKSPFGFIGEFYARRLARILPALVVVLIVAAFLATAFIPPVWLSGLSENTAQSAFFGFSNWVLMTNADTYFAPRAEFNPYTHTWSLGVEEQFYLLVPLLVYFWVRARQYASAIGARLVLAALGALTLGSLVASAWATTARPTEAFYFIGFRFWELGSGTLLFLVTESWPAARVRPKWRFAAEDYSSLAGLAAVVSGFLLTDPLRFPWPMALLPVLGTLLLIQGAHVGPAGHVRSWLGSAVPVWIGKRSYSLYLWHWPIYVLLRWTVGLESALTYAIATVATFGLASLTYRWVEQPFRHNRWIERRPPWQRLPIFAVLPILGFFFASYSFTHRESLSLSTVVVHGVDWDNTVGRMAYPDVGDRRCRVDVEYYPVGEGTERKFIPRDCRGAASTRQMWMLGDSHAYMLASMLDQASAEFAMPVSLIDFLGCAYIGLMRPMYMESAACLAFDRDARNRVASAARPGDIVVLPSLRMKKFGNHTRDFKTSDMEAVLYGPEPMKLRVAAELEAEDWLRIFAEKRLDVVFVAPTPMFSAPPFRCSDWFNKMNPICISHGEQDRTYLEALRRPILDAMRRLSDIYPNVRIWDPFPLLCPGDTCRAMRGDKPLYFDGDHVSGYGALMVYPSFRKDVIMHEGG